MTRNYEAEKVDGKLPMHRYQIKVKGDPGPGREFTKDDKL